MTAKKTMPHILLSSNTSTLSPSKVYLREGSKVLYSGWYICVCLSWIIYQPTIPPPPPPSRPLPKSMLDSVQPAIFYCWLASEPKDWHVSWSYEWFSCSFIHLIFSTTPWSLFMFLRPDREVWKPISLSRSVRHWRCRCSSFSSPTCSVRRAYSL